LVAFEVEEWASARLLPSRRLRKPEREATEPLLMYVVSRGLDRDQTHPFVEIQREVRVGG
jgi:hypothetical protein